MSPRTDLHSNAVQSDDFGRANTLQIKAPGTESGRRMPGRAGRTCASRACGPADMPCSRRDFHTVPCVGRRVHLRCFVLVESRGHVRQTVGTSRGHCAALRTSAWRWPEPSWQYPCGSGQRKRGGGAGHQSRTWECQTWRGDKGRLESLFASQIFWSECSMRSCGSGTSSGTRLSPVVG